MNTRHSDLIAIANADLAEKLIRGQSKINKDKTKQKGEAAFSFIANTSESDEAAINADHAVHQSFQQDAWRAVYTLNVFRYALGLGLLILVTASAIDANWQLLGNVVHPKLFFLSALALLGSAIVFQLCKQAS